MASDAGADGIQAHQVDDSGNHDSSSAIPNDMSMIRGAVEEMAKEQEAVFKRFQEELNKIYLRDAFEIGPHANEIGGYEVPMDMEFGWLLYRRVEIRIKNPDMVFKSEELNYIKKRGKPLSFVVYNVKKLARITLGISVYELRNESIETHFCKVMQRESTGLPQQSSKNILNFTIFAGTDPHANNVPATLDYTGVAIEIGGYLQNPKTTAQDAATQKFVTKVSVVLEKDQKDSDAAKKIAKKGAGESSAVLTREHQVYPKISRQNNRLTKSLLRDFFMNAMMRPGQISVIFSNPLSLKMELESRIKTLSGKKDRSTCEEIMHLICTRRLHEIENGHGYADLSTECDKLLYANKLRRMKLSPCSILFYLEMSDGITCTHALLEYAKTIDEIVASFLSNDKREIPDKITRTCSNTEECVESLRFLLTCQASHKTTNVYLPNEWEYAQAFKHVVSFVFMDNLANIKCSIKKLPIALWISHFTSFGSVFRPMLHIVLSEYLLLANEQLVRRFFDKIFGVKVVEDSKLSQLFAKRQLDDSEAGTVAVPPKRRRVFPNTQEETSTDSAPGAAKTGSGGTDDVVFGKRKRKPSKRLEETDDRKIRKFRRSFAIPDYSDEETKQGSGSDSEESRSGDDSDAD